MDSSNRHHDVPDPGEQSTTLFTTKSASDETAPSHASVDREQPERPAAPGREQKPNYPEGALVDKPNEEPRPTTPGQGTSERQTMAGHELPDEAELVTVEEAVVLFREAGLPRHIRTIQKYCARQSGRALVCHQTPTENGIRYLIEKTSIDRFIADAAQQAPTGTLETEGDTVTKPRSETDNVERTAPASDLDIFEHPYVKRLEGQVERLETKNDRLQGEIKNVLEHANERLIELQKASAVAQSETLGAFLLEAERIRTEKTDQNDEPVPAPVDIGRTEAREHGV